MTGIKVRGVEEVQEFLKTVPHGSKRAIIQAFTDWFIGNPQRGLRHYSPYKYVTRKRAYGKTFVSDAQRRFVMAMIRAGKIEPGTPRRTGKTQRGWTSNTTNNGYGVAIKNDEVGAFYSMDDEGQARLNALGGWRKVSKVVSDNMAGALRHANAAVREFLKNKK